MKHRARARHLPRQQIAPMKPTHQKRMIGPATLALTRTREGPQQGGTE